MSRVTTPSVPQQSGSSTSSTPNYQTGKVSQEKIAMRAYEKWCQRGKPQGTQMQDWLEAERELQSEGSRTSSPSSVSPMSSTSTRK